MATVKTKIIATKKIQPSNYDKDWTLDDITLRDGKLFELFNQILGTWLNLEFEKPSDDSSGLTPEQIAAIELLKKSGFTVNK